MPGKLILLPNMLDECLPPDAFVPSTLAATIKTIQGLIAESEKAGRRYLRKFLTHDEMAATPIQLLNEHTKELHPLLAPLLQGQTWGLVTDAGLPCIADPGAELVWLAREKGIAIETHPGPSSIIYALQLSGFISQRFAFHGYLPRESPEQAIRALEQRSKAEQAPQLFIEAPYRSTKLLQTLLTTLAPSTRLCVAASLTLPQELIISQPISRWKPIDLGKVPAVFVVSA